MMMAWFLGVADVLQAQSPPVHYYHQGIMPPGAIGAQQLQRGGPLPGYFQPVEIKAPRGASISLAVEQRFDPSQSTPQTVGLLIGAVYRVRVTNIPLAAGVEVFPTIEVIDRLYAPPGREQNFAIPVDITEGDLRLAMAGKFVTRVIYLEDPHQALPARADLPSQNWFEAAPGQDPLAVADGLGRPVAILRMGGRLPSPGDMDDPNFFYGSPPFMAMCAATVPTTPVEPKPAPVAAPVEAAPASAPSAKTILPPRILPVLPGVAVGQGRGGRP